VVLAGCSEREQVVAYKNGKYQGKPDTRPWDNPPPAYGPPEWTKGDRAAWEGEMRSRNAGQNEYGRIGH
jgi:hypothetical protein